MEFSSNNLSSTTDEATDYCAPSWAHGLRKVGLYYIGFVEDIDWILWQHRKDIVTFYGTRNSTLSHDKENVEPDGNDEILLCITMITNVVYLLNVTAIFYFIERKYQVTPWCFVLEQLCSWYYYFI